VPALVLEYACQVIEEEEHSREWLVDGGSSAVILRGSSDPPVSTEGTRRKRSRVDCSEHDRDQLMISFGTCVIDHKLMEVQTLSLGEMLTIKSASFEVVGKK
jgi:hypothetical protein